MPAAILVPLIVGAATVGAGALEASAARRQQSQALAMQQQATDAQERASRAAEEDAQLQATGQSAAQRIARASGLRVLQFQGASASNDNTTLGSTAKGVAANLGG